MKKLLIISLFFSSGLLFANSPKPVEYKPTEILKNIDQLIGVLAQNKSCVQKAKTHGDARACLKTLSRQYKTLQKFKLFGKMGVNINK